MALPSTKANRTSSDWDPVTTLKALAERKPLSAAMCLKVARLFGGTPEFWMRLQAAYDMKQAEQNKKIMARVARIVPIKPDKEVRA